VLLATAGCAPEPAGVVSLLGIELPPPTLTDAFREQQEGLLAEARAALDEATDDPDALIWVGRRTAYLGRYAEAIEIYGRGIERHPDHAALYRHRGHRYISTRRLDLAIADLERAAELIEGTPDVVEPDGLPNERNIPTSTSHSNIWYHLGLARYLQGDLEGARAAYVECMKFSRNPDMLSATSHWLYMTLRRLGRDDDAQALLAPIHADMDVIENRDYHRLLLMYKGETTPEEIRAAIDSAEDGVGSATIAYGLANWYHYNGETERADELFRGIVQGESWAAFGYIAAEAELARR
jgi:tetratricopeptide (TPR) repeat protein